ncbi:anti-sigma B factor antagonist [Neobacillus niacini]|uniref:anti-sigma factor antagonist n=1 Tax=Neobacillus niacini TaxID=86668 RepID=UPI00277D34E7|nr:anti-sigma factor antagonist [Neobacillus niacini]MDQ1000246.1 anti-sigma B factor antagonist [Neobacillus niacini]
MKVNIEKHQSDDKKIFVSVSGEIDAYTAPKLREELLPLTEGKNKVITVNLKDVSYMDSTGLGVFVGLLKQLNNNEGELKLVELSDRLKRLFKITGLSTIMNIEEDGGR